MSVININIQSNLIFDLDPDGIRRKIAIKLTENTKKRFLKGESPEGDKWASKSSGGSSHLRK